MKKVIILLVLALIFACSSDDDNSDNIEEYRLTRYQAGFLNIDTFAEDDVKWSFNFSTNVLTVENNVIGMYPGTVPSGMYDFTFENNMIEFEYNMLNYPADFNLTENDTVLTLFFDFLPNVVDEEVLYMFDRI